MDKIVLDDIASGYNLNKINVNFDRLEQALNNNVLYRDNPEGTTNTIKNDLDLDGNDLLNVGDLRVLGVATIGGKNIDSINSALVWRGPWNSATSYGISDGVSYNGSSFISLIPNTDVTPVEGATWGLLAEKGLGATGSGDVYGPSLSAIGSIVVFSDTTGKNIIDSEVSVSSVLKTSDIGFNVQAYDPNIAKINVNQTFIKGQSGGILPLTDAGTIALDMEDANFFSVTLAGNRTLANPTNLVPGQSGSVFISQDSTGGRTLAFASYWDFEGGVAPVLSTGANKVDRLDYVVRTTTSIHAAVSKGWS